jgi:hypothetical protein
VWVKGESENHDTVMSELTEWERYRLIAIASLGPTLGPFLSF